MLPVLPLAGHRQLDGQLCPLDLVLAMTTVNVAVPDVMGAFGIGQDKAQWMSSAYMATYDQGMPINTSLTGTLGERRTFIGALVFFPLGALMGGINAPTEDALIFARVLQGFKAGIASVVGHGHDLHRPPAGLPRHGDGQWRPGVVFAPAIGPTLGGLMIEYFSWRYVFFISLPFCVVAAVLGLRVHADSGSIPKVIPPFDWLGFALLRTALLGLMTGIADGQRGLELPTPSCSGWSSARWPRSPFVCWELYTPRALLDVRIFGNVEFSAAAPHRLHLRRRHDVIDLHLPRLRADHHRLHAAAGWSDDDAGRHHAGLYLSAGRPPVGRDAGLDHDHRRAGPTLLRASAWMTTADIDTTFLTLVCMVMVSRLGLGFINFALNASSPKPCWPTRCARARSCGCPSPGSPSAHRHGSGCGPRRRRPSG